MTKQFLNGLLTFLLIIGFSANAKAQKKKKGKDEAVPAVPAPKPKKNAIEPYSKVVTADAVTDEGLFKVHFVDEAYLFEIPVYEAVMNSNFEPVLYTFPIKAFNNDKTSTVIDVTELFTTDIKPLGLPEYVRKQYKITKLEPKNSFIKR